ncbi:caspase-1-like isoform X2 [Penaeus chinensis]|nr:caspase-1-like isoform X2 [Penaeus chinensis]XP_047474588.1 caspase-1-like isoform X2 [Penaeus chinensis]XP_047474589.1 caspase-1-like isoform X2 [Penaeus chinensis]
MGFRKKLRAFFRITQKRRALEYKARSSEPNKQIGPKSEQSKSEQSKSKKSQSEKSQSEKSDASPANVVGEKPGQVGMDEWLAVRQEGGGEVKAKTERVYMQQPLECDGQAAATESVAAATPPTYAESLASGESSPTQSCTDLPEATSPTESNHVKFCNDTCLTHLGTHDRQRRRRACRQRKESLSGIKVKYTKVYGENDGAYKNDSTPRGLVFMCNFSQFMNDRYGQRKGSEMDYYSMLDLFQQLGYGGGRRDEKYCMTGHITKNRFMERLKDFSVDTRHKMLCSSVIIIMSHGLGPKTFVTSDDKQVDLMEIYTMFNNINCEILRGKPKIFILQFCRNNSYMPSSRFRNKPLDLPFTESLRQIVREEINKILAEQTEDKAEAPPSPGISEDQRRYSEPALMESERQVRNMWYEADTRLIAPQPAFEGVQKYSDMYSIFSTASGELSYRDPHKGSLLIQAICHVFAENAYQDDIDTLVRKVSTYMTKTLQKDDPITVPRVTCERTNNGLDKKFYFNPEEVHRCRHVTI